MCFAGSELLLFLCLLGYLGFGALLVFCPGLSGFLFYLVIGMISLLFIFLCSSLPVLICMFLFFVARFWYLQVLACRVLVLLGPFAVDGVFWICMRGTAAYARGYGPGHSVPPEDFGLL